MHLILFGFKGCGKTYLGKKVSQRLGCPFFDTDPMIVDLYAEKTGIRFSLRTLYQTLGETTFRKWEREVIDQLPNAKTEPRAVIALGGGAILPASQAAHLQTLGKLVYLKMGFPSLCQRILQGGIPPFIDPTHPVKSLYELYCKRTPIYEAISAHAVDLEVFGNEEEILAILCQIGKT